MMTLTEQRAATLAEIQQQLERIADRDRCRDIEFNLELRFVPRLLWVTVGSGVSSCLFEAPKLGQVHVQNFQECPFDTLDQVNIHLAVVLGDIPF